MAIFLFAVYFVLLVEEGLVVAWGQHCAMGSLKRLWAHGCPCCRLPESALAFFMSLICITNTSFIVVGHLCSNPRINGSIHLVKFTYFELTEQ